jgi:hypothetical protein
MAQLLIPGLILPAPNDQTRTADNFNVLQRWAKSVSPRMLAVGDPIVGTNPPQPPSDAYVAIRGVFSVHFTGGLGTLTLPLAFPNGWLSLALGGSEAFTYTAAGATLSTIQIVNPVGGTATVNVDVDAVGW